jgi:hypothetical protein
MQLGQAGTELKGDRAKRVRPCLVSFMAAAGRVSNALGIERAAFFALRRVLGKEPPILRFGQNLTKSFVVRGKGINPIHPCEMISTSEHW